MSSSDSSVSYFNERLDKLEEPTKVKNGFDGPGGDIQIPDVVSLTLKARCVSVPLEW